MVTAVIAAAAVVVGGFLASAVFAVTSFAFVTTVYVVSNHSSLSQSLPANFLLSLSHGGSSISIMPSHPNFIFRFLYHTIPIFFHIYIRSLMVLSR
jgi:hypothetical protein